MAAYVDDMRARKGRMVFCHMLADSEGELLAMADAIGVARRRRHGDHFDVCLAKRALAVSLGAREITLRQAAAMCRRRRETGSLGCPDEALEWFASRTSLRSGGLPPAPCA